MAEANIHLRLLYTFTLDIHSVWAIVMLSQWPMGAPLYHLAPQIWEFRITWWVKMMSLQKWCHYIMFEADFHLKASMLDKYKVFQPLLCCLKGIWVQPYTIEPAKLAPYLGIQVHLVTWKWSHYTMFEAETHLRPLHTSISDKKNGLSNYYAVSRAYGCTLIPLHPPSSPQLWEFRFSLVEWKRCHNVMAEANIHLRLLYTFTLDIHSVWAIVMLSQWPMDAPLYHYTGQVGPRFGYSGSLDEWKWCHCKIDVMTSCLRLISTSNCFIHPC